MDREIIIQNIMANYGKYGITPDMINEVIDAGLEGGMSYAIDLENHKNKTIKLV